MSTPRDGLEIVFVHGALVSDGDWWWAPVARIIAEQAGVASRSVALPSCGEAGATAGENGLVEDAAALRRLLDTTASAIVVGHSYGGTVAAEGADHPAVRHLVAISSYLPDPGSTQAGIMAGEPDPVRVAGGPDGTVHVDGYDADEFGQRFWGDVPDESIRAGAWARVVPQGASAFGTPTTAAAWRGRPSTYLVCAEDRSTSPALQRRHAARAGRSVELPTGHHPFLSRPDLVADQLLRILREE